MESSHKSPSRLDLDQPNGLKKKSLSDLTSNQLKSDQARSLMDLRNRFINHLRSSRKSPHTIFSYRKNINRFVLFVDESSLPLSQYTRKHFNEFLDSLKPFGPTYQSGYLSASAQLQLITSLRMFIRFCSEDLEHPYFPQKDWSRIICKDIEKEERLPKTLSFDEIEAMVSVIRKDHRGAKGRRIWQTDVNSIKDKLFIRLLFSTGLRISEMGSLQVQDCVVRNGQIRVKRGKGKKESWVYIGSTAAGTLDEYLTMTMKKNKLEDYVFFDKSPDIMDLKGFEVMVRRRLRICARESGVNADIAPHMLRHSFAVDLLERGADIRSIQDLLRHKNLSSTQIYTKISDKRKESVYKQFKREV